jgi:hypothetical protein
VQLRAAIGFGLLAVTAAVAVALARPLAHASPFPAAQARPLQEAPTPSPAAQPLPSAEGPNPTYAPSPTPAIPQPVVLSPASILVLLGHISSASLVSPASGIVIPAVADPSIAKVVFNPLNRTLEVTGLHAGSTTATITSDANLTASLAITVQVSAGKAFDSASTAITGHPASVEFVQDSAARAAERVAYPQAGAVVAINPATISDARPLPPDDTQVAHVPVSIKGAGYYPYHTTVTVRLTNLVQPREPPKYLLVSDFPETITEDGTLFYADINRGSPARLLYYHYAPKGAPTRRVLVKVQNNGVASSSIELIAGLAGPSPDILYTGHISTYKFLKREAAGEGEIFDVPPRTTINVVDQRLPANALVSGLMQLRVIDGSGVRVAVIVQDANDSPIDPISDTLLTSAERHARGIYQVPEFFYDEYYVAGAAPTILVLGKLPLPNMAVGEVLGGDYGVKQSAQLTLLNPTNDQTRMGIWFEPRGGRATGTFLLDGDVLQLHSVDPFKPVLLRSWLLPPHGYRRVSLVTMPEGGSSYPVNVLVSSQPPDGGAWGVTRALY